MQTSENADQLAIRNILYTTDFSAAAERALPYAREIARRCGSMLYAVHVLPPGADTLVSASATTKNAEEGAVQRQGRRDLEERLLGILHEIIFLSGKVWQSLIEFIQERGMDLIVFSAHGRTGFDKETFGSVATDLFWNAPCPALIVGPAVSAKSGENAALQRILYATDFTFESLCAVPHAIALARQHHAQPILLHAIQSGEDVPAMLYALRQLIPLGAELQHQPECVVEQGEPTSKIVEVADRHHADLIVLGLHDPTNSLRKHFATSGVFKIITQAKCPVLTVRA
jgi:nucleotide-binding universal stress UspA family protein